MSKNRVLATCRASDCIGDLVCVDRSVLGSGYAVVKADITQREKTPAIAIILAKTSDTKAVLQLEGDIVGLYTGLIPGGIYYTGHDSRPTPTPPLPVSGVKTYVQTIGYAINDIVLKLKPSENIVARGAL